MGLDAQVICPSGKINRHVGWVEPFAKPITVQKVMGIASLHPSYALLQQTKVAMGPRVRGDDVLYGAFPPKLADRPRPPKLAERRRKAYADRLRVRDWRRMHATVSPSS